LVREKYMKFHVPPENQGQIVEVSYSAEDPDVLIKRVEDRSDRSVEYYSTPWTKTLSRWAESRGPWNTPPPTVKRWKKIAAEQVLEG
jgi:hypothetical protein